jgi:hypothetical protein
MSRICDRDIERETREYTRISVSEQIRAMAVILHRHPGIRFISGTQDFMDLLERIRVRLWRKDELVYSRGIRLDSLSPVWMHGSK